MTGADAETIRSLAAAVVGIGLGTDMGYGHLRLDPALPPYLLRELSQADQEHLQARWAEGMEQLVRYLHGQQFQAALLAAQLTLLELPNVLAVLALLPHTAVPDEVL